MAAKLMNIEFQFEDQPVQAFVALQDKGYDLSFRIHYKGGVVKRYLPSCEARFSLLKGIEKPEECDKNAEALIMKTSEAITRFLQQTG